nr:energy transducer TonB [uncultured Carboxylicivirga sp.]
MKKVLSVVAFGIMALGLTAQNNTKSINEGDIPARLKTNEIQRLEEVTVLPQSPLCCFMQKEIEYPEQCAIIGEEGQVVVQFIIETNGEIRDLKVINPVSKLLDDQVVYCLKKTSGLWAPAIEHGQAIESVHKLYVTFDIEGNKSLGELSAEHYKNGIQYIVKGDEIRSDYFLSQDKKLKKADRQYRYALNHFNVAKKLQAEEAAIIFWQSKVYERLGDLSMMKDKLDEYHSVLMPDEFENKDYVCISYPLNKK